MRLLTSFISLLISEWVFAAEEKVIPSLSNEPVGLGNYLQMFFGLFIVVAIIFGMAWFMRRMGNMQGIAAGNLKVLGGVSVGQRERVVLLQAGEVQLLLGVAPGEVRTLHVMDEPIFIDTNKKSGLTTGFAEKLQSAIKQRKSS